MSNNDRDARAQRSAEFRAARQTLLNELGALPDKFGREWAISTMEGEGVPRPSATLGNGANNSVLLAGVAAEAICADNAEGGRKALVALAGRFEEFLGVGRNDVPAIQAKLRACSEKAEELGLSATLADVLSAAEKRLNAA